eukprot:TRINITY_DN81431_c0_g1_i1.p1 TRINITY_DN81431_c0_g1~~TRINITY_DN81431_c0_g1_i1.p1  ORF type:complete len:327 (-),score=56.98 TRINITY_DN81431_c0_g1_i1:67-1008(-)
MPARVKRPKDRHDSPSNTAALGRPLLTAAPDPAGEKGICLRATRDVRAGDAVLVEVPLLGTAAPSAAYRDRLRKFCAALAKAARNKASSLLPLLAERWLPVLRCFAEASTEVRDKVLGLQTEFANPDCEMAKAVAVLAQVLQRSGIFAGAREDSEQDKGKDELAAGGVELREEVIAGVLSAMIINAADTMPDGSEALFYMGALIEHSCDPSTSFCVYQAEDADASRGVGHLAGNAWVGEWRATQDISAGTPVTFSYLEPARLKQDVNQRREIINKRMGFVCQCRRCKLESCEVNNQAGYKQESSVPIDFAEMD